MAKLNQRLEEVKHVFQADRILKIERIQELWGGYGSLSRVHVSGDSRHCSVIVKHIQLPQPASHPRGWNTQRSHQRKLRSYEVEVHWYQHFAHLCDRTSPVPGCLHLDYREDEILLVMEDLGASGFPLVLKQATNTGIHSCLSWLASFHARFMGNEPNGLWPVGTYWHLDTRPDELQALEDEALKSAAGSIDHILRHCRYQTLIHGDAKLANFCFSEDQTQVAAVDFQYVGQGCGMKDVILFLSSVLNFNESEEEIEAYLDHYFEQLKLALTRYHPDIDGKDVERVWRPLYCLAWADFQRFVKGWSPGHWKINPYTESLTQRALTML